MQNRELRKGSLARKSMKNLAPRDEHRSEHAFGEFWGRRGLSGLPRATTYWVLFAEAVLPKALVQNPNPELLELNGAVRDQTGSFQVLY